MRRDRGANSLLFVTHLRSDVIRASVPDHPVRDRISWMAIVAVMMTSLMTSPHNWPNELKLEVTEKNR